MSFQNLILGSKSSKPEQNLKVNTLSCNSIEADNIEFENIAINQISSLNTGTVDITSPLILQDVSHDNSLTKYLVINDDGDVKYSNVPVNNPFNQSLNTTDSPTFQNLFIADEVNLLSTAQDNSLTKHLVIDNSGVIKYSTNSSNPFNQSLNTTDSPAFDNLLIVDELNLPNTAQDNSLTKHLVIDNTGIVKYSTNSSNPFNQSLNTTDSALFSFLNLTNDLTSITGSVNLTNGNFNAINGSGIFLGTETDNIQGISSSRVPIEMPKAKTLTDEYSSGTFTCASGTLVSTPSAMTVINAGSSNYNTSVLNTSTRTIQFSENGVYLVKLNIALTSLFTQGQSILFEFRSNNVSVDRISQTIYGADLSGGISTITGILIPGPSGLNLDFTIHSNIVLGLGTVNSIVTFTICRIK